MIECQSCSGRAELYLCEPCITEFRADLTRLHQGPHVTANDVERHTQGLLADLYDVVVGQTRLGGSGGHRKRGDELPAPYEPDTEKGKPTGQGTANALLDLARSALSSIVRDFCESRVVICPASTSPAAAAFLAAHVHAIACEESAGIWKREISNLVARIEKALDRPEPPRFCGPCTHYVEHNRHCGRLLYAKHDAIEVTCGTCRTRHNIDRLTRDLESRIGSMRFTSSEILAIMRTLRRVDELPLSERSWSRWRKDGRVKVRGYKRPDNDDGTRGAVGLHRRSDDDEPVYRLSEVRRVHDAAIKHADVVVT